MTVPATPMMTQWARLKAEEPQALLLFRLGDFYELFAEDAEQAAPILELVLTGRDGVPMCGVPHHALDAYVGKLIERGLRVAIAEQMEDPALARGLVQRAIVRVLTPGTVQEPDLLPAGTPSYCCAVWPEGGWGLAVADASTGELLVTELADAEALAAELDRLQPREVLLPPGLELEAPGVRTSLPRERFDPSLVARHFGEVPEGAVALPAAGALLSYLEEVQRDRPRQFTAITPYSADRYLLLDPVAQRNLELTRRLVDGAAAGTLLHAIDHTLTAMGARRLRAWLLQPLTDPKAIHARLDAVEELVGRPLLLDALRRGLRGIHDMERLVARVACERCSPRELGALARSLVALPGALSPLLACSSELLTAAVVAADPCADVAERLSAALVDEPPPTAGERGIFRDGWDPALDQLRAAARDGRGWLAELEARERERTGIRTLKVGFNRVFGYYLEVGRSRAQDLPADYQRKQTLASAERFITPELKGLEEQILGAEERSGRLEQAMFIDLRKQVAARAAALQRTARTVAELDALGSLAEAAARGRYVRPAVDLSLRLTVRGGRHPVLEQALGRTRFVPNDAELDGAGRRFLLITGPNMAGKSTYMRQLALLVVMAQMGSFVPAEEAQVGIVDRIFTRVGASDDLAGGRSTFMVEMAEVATLLRAATRRSLLLLDEVGRGTSTLDGLAIAWAVAEFVAARVRARALFATHFHELTSALPDAVNLHSAVAEREGQVTFLHRVLPGASDRSYGVHVARLAGLPDEVVARAQDLLASLQAQG
ncbi:MAG TPA: DNA mismatch repair protein MutS, partial [Bacillota bacterium]|nr:DNA mismatch repair protein MutS [Bacillota bacterium]